MTPTRIASAILRSYAQDAVNWLVGAFVLVTAIARQRYDELRAVQVARAVERERRAVLCSRDGCDEAVPCPRHRDVLAEMAVSMGDPAELDADEPPFAVEPRTMVERGDLHMYDGDGRTACERALPFVARCTLTLAQFLADPHRCPECARRIAARREA